MAVAVMVLTHPHSFSATTLIADVDYAVALQRLCRRFGPQDIQRYFDTLDVPPFHRSGAID
jgi:hypothetical protein